LPSRPAPQGAETPAAPAVGRPLIDRLHQLHKLVDRETQLAFPTATGLGPSDGRCLAVAGAAGPLSVNELARLSQLDKGQASRAAQSLVALGLLRRQAHPHDARSVQLSLTAAGRRTWQRTIRLLAQRDDAAFACLSDRDRATLGRLLDRLIEHNGGMGA